MLPDFVPALIIGFIVARRVYLAQIVRGNIALPADQAHHVRDVLRLTEGAAIEVFDAGGAVGQGVIWQSDPGRVVVRVDSFTEAASTVSFRWTIASAIPKASRADWMIEKLSELGTSAFTPLLTDRSVAEPKGQAKMERWSRLAMESAKQSRRVGVMNIHPPARLEEAIGDGAWYLSLEEDAMSIAEAFESDIKNQKSKIDVFVGPEGGWSPRELELFKSKRLTPIALTATILRIETAAIAAAAVLGSLARRIATPTKGPAT